MKRQISEGKEVTLNAYGGSISRVAIEVLDDVVLVCRPDELLRAKQEGRDPLTVGFRLADVVQE